MRNLEQMLKITNTVVQWGSNSAKIETKMAFDYERNRLQYSGDPNTGHSNYGTIQKTDFYQSVMQAKT